MEERSMQPTLEDFLKENNFTKDQWDGINTSWDDLLSIRIDHETNVDYLENASELIVKVLQKLPQVHSVRWRVKDPDHLVAKIIRKKIERVKKYDNISISNYKKVVTDLVGIRALHLFKHEFLYIDALIKSTWNVHEKAVAYIRKGDDDSALKESGFRTKEHKAGYRSIHYIIESAPSKSKVLSEIQVRTVFEEAWSEIDHKVRYPDYTDDRLVKYFLDIFNVASGLADSMGGFLLGLVSSIHEREVLIEQQNNLINETSAELKKEKAKSHKDKIKIDGLENKLSSMEMQRDMMKYGIGSAAQNIPQAYLGVGGGVLGIAGINVSQNTSNLTNILSGVDVARDSVLQFGSMRPASEAYSGKYDPFNASAMVYNGDKIEIKKE